MMVERLRLAVFKFASCDGCQLSILDCLNSIMEVRDRLEIVHFLEASSRIESGPYDISLVEGSISTPNDYERIRKVRRESTYLVTIGACATAGGIQALRNWGDHTEFLRAVYATPDYIASLAESTAVADHVRVDYELRGCPIDRHQLLEVLRARLEGRRPRIPDHPVCLDCKRAGHVCVMVTKHLPCLGPVTHTGCGAICPSVARGCYGCFGPSPQPNLQGLSNQFKGWGAPTESLIAGLRLFNAYAPSFRQESERLVQIEMREGSHLP